MITSEQVNTLGFKLKFSIITTTFNSSLTIQDNCISVHNQTHQNYQHLIIDNNSSDDTVKEINLLNLPNIEIYSEKDEGIYDALNKGIHKSNGDIICILHSDDFYLYNEVLEEVNNIFINNINADIVYADLKYVSKNDMNKVVRNWKAGAYTSNKIKLGWMPPHPTLFIRKEYLSRVGEYNKKYKIASDYDFILRSMLKNSPEVHYLDNYIIGMRAGGESNKSLKKIIQKTTEDYRIMRSYGMSAIRALLYKNFSKIRQFFK